jgi:trigger factor
MSAKDVQEPEVDEVEGAAIEGDAVEGDGAEPERLNLDVKIDSPSACERHVTVTVSREDVDRYLDAAYSEMMATASVPGFRIGRAPRKLVESRFKDEIGEKIKGSLLMDSLSQISEDQSFTAISEPELKLDAIEVPDDGPMVFEFDIEVRPEFDLPKWQGLKIERPMREFTDADVADNLEQMLARYGQLVPFEGAAEAGDYVTANIRVTHEGKEITREEERVLRLRPTLSFLDGKLEGFAKLLAGVKVGDKKSGTVELTQDAPNEELRGKKVDVEFEVLDVKKLKLPELTADFLQEMGGFESEDKLREAIRANLQRQLEYEQQRKARQQITSELLKKADWDLPPGLLKRQSVRELERAVMELRRAGFGESEIRARQNELRQHSASSTGKALKEHFILERIAEEEKIEAEEGDFESEIFLIAMQSGESPRRVRAQIEKRGLMDVLQNQIVERKVLERVQAEAKFKDIPFAPSKVDAEAISMAAGGDTDAIPAAEIAEAAEKEG